MREERIMASKKSKGYRVEFSIEDLSFLEQEKIYQHLISGLDFTQKEKLHITIFDPIGGSHHVWDNTGVTPEQIFCKECHELSCEKCKTYLRLSERNNVD